MELQFLVEVACFWPEYGFQVCKIFFFISKIHNIHLFLGYDILSHDTETDILDGIVSIIIATLFVSLGVYSQR